MADFANLVVGVDTSGLKRGERDIQSFGGSAKKSFNAVALAAGAALGAFVSLGSAVRIIADFESSISRLGAVSRATGSELESLRNIAKELGSTTEFSASQAADGLNFLAMAGFNAAEAMAAIPAVLDLATASQMGLAEAADTASNIMSGFGISADNAAQVADVLAAASTRANTTVGQLGSAMSTVAPIAKALDISLSDTAAAIGVLSDAGIQGERAGTALRGVLASLAGPTSEAEKVLKGLGLTLSDVDPAANDLSVVMARLGDAGLSTADAMTLFGREAASGALVLIDGANRVGEFGDELDRVDGAAKTMAATMRDNLGGDLKGVISAAEGLAIALGDAGLTTVLRVVVRVMTVMAQAAIGAVNAIGSITNAIGSFLTASNQEQLAIDNVTLAMGDNIKQANSLFTLMGTGQTITQSAALAKLSEAEAHLRTADALRKERDAVLSLQQAQLTLNYQRETEALNSIRAGTDAYEEREQSIVRILSNMGDLQAIQQSANGDFAAATAEVERIRKAIGNAVDGMVTFDGEVITAIDLGNRLATAITNISFDNAISGASFLANDLGVNIELAKKLNAALDRSAGIEAPKPAAGGARGLGFGLGNADTGAIDGVSLAYGNLTEPVTGTNIATKALSGGGGGGGGGGVSDAAREAQREMNNLQSESDRIIRGLMAPMDEYNAAVEQANTLLDAGVLGLGDYTTHIEQLGVELQNQQPFIADFKSSILDAAMGGVNSFDALRDAIIRAGLEYALFGTGQFAPKGGSGFGGLFGGVMKALSFDGGGFTGSGPRSGGMDGRGGFPAILHPNETVVDHTRGGSSGNQSLNVTVTMDPSTGALGAFVRDQAGRIVAQATPGIASQAVAQTQAAFRNSKQGFTPA
jgi:TP901 family phage tail tape measure protein